MQWASKASGTDGADLKKIFREHPLAAFVLSAAGIGASPIAPGTFASALTLLALWLLKKSVFDFQEQLLIVLAILIVLASASIWALRTVGQLLAPLLDRPFIVVDELIGMTIAASPLFFVGTWHWVSAITAFALFRVFDIAKPAGIAKIDRRQTALSVLGDDVVAGLLSALILALLLVIA